MIKIALEAHKHPSINCKTVLLYFGIIMTDSFCILNPQCHCEFTMLG